MIPACAPRAWLEALGPVFRGGPLLVFDALLAEGFEPEPAAIAARDAGRLHPDPDTRRYCWRGEWRSLEVELPLARERAKLAQIALAADRYDRHFARQPFERWAEIEAQVPEVERAARALVREARRA